MAGAELTQLSDYDHRRPAQQDTESLMEPGKVLSFNQRARSARRVARNVLMGSAAPEHRFVPPVTVGFSADAARTVHDLASKHGMTSEQLLAQAANRGIETIGLEDEGYTLYGAKPRTMTTPWGITWPLPPEIKIFDPIDKAPHVELY